ncbi:hypothetical protein EG328_005664 [Venturia inaequalis]|uniref:SH3 domain-containing protein n=1 Tax=Venturia inaequalis TaxID=5025 RepID=A0A8H3VVP2_VENIN|nr:hypothetical protein EG328_005664 [Venturia inaequalis]KAE9994866.1 hypothetical protein EG327_000080 [Venturia inaequalis]
MDPMARINFGKMYTIEHNVKVYDWQYVLGIDTRATQVESSGSDRDNKKVEGICEQQPLEDGKVTELELPANFAALWSWTASDHGQLVFQAGDTISITEYADSDWARGKNLRTGRTGVFPRNYVQLS